MIVETRVSVPPRLATPALAVAAAVCWTVFARPVDPGALGSFGLAAALHPVVLLAVALLSVAFVLELAAAAPRVWVLAGACLLAVVGVYGLPPVVEPVVRLPVAWLHAGWTDYIATHGEVLTGFDARFSWPAFFGALAWLSDVAAVDPTVLLAWAPPVCTGLAAAGVHAVATAVAGPGRVPWLAVWLFLAANWVEQDYFSPQALAFLGYLGALVLVLRWLLTESRAPNRFGAAVLLVLLICGLAPTHQVTPFALAAVLTVLAVAGRLRHRWLCVLAVLVPLTWLVLGAADFWTGHLDMLTGGVGDLSGAVQENIGARVTGDTGRIAVLALRFGLAGAVLALAVLGWWRAGRPVALGCAALVPFGLVALQSYGGEMVLRAFLYALPLLCAFGGVATDRLLHSGLPRRLAVAAMLGALSVAVIVARGGNDGYVAFRAEDVAIAGEAYRIMRPGQSVVSLTAHVPLRFERVGEVRQESLERVCPPSRDAGYCVLGQAPDAVLITRAQDNYGVTMFGLPPGWTRSVADRLVESGEFEERRRRGAAVLLVRVATEGDVR